MISNIHKLRLATFAAHLCSNGLKNKYENLDYLNFRKSKYLFFFQEKGYLIYPALELELEHVFSKYYTKNYSGNIIYYPSPNTSVIFTMCYFFGISTEQFENLFLVRKQTIPGLIPITKNSSPKAYGKNILRFIKLMDDEMKRTESTQERKIIIEKISKNHPNKIFERLKNS